MDNDNLFADEQLTPAQQRTLKEMGRMSLDRIRVYNPLDEDYNVRWDGLYFLVPGKNKDIGYGKGQAVHPRYVAVKFARELTDKILGEKMLTAVKAENDRRVAAGLAKMTKYDGENSEYGYAMQFNPNDVSERTKVLTMVWLGVESKYGMDTPQSNPEQEQRRDPRNIDEMILEQLERPAAQRVDVAEQPIEQDAAPITDPSSQQPPQPTQDTRESLFETLEQ